MRGRALVIAPCAYGFSDFHCLAEARTGRWRDNFAATPVVCASAENAAEQNAGNVQFFAVSTGLVASFVIFPDTDFVLATRQRFCGTQITCWSD